MKKIITAFVFCFLCGECFSQVGEWVWIKGDSIPNQPGNYGMQGVPSPTNNPPSLYEPCEWTDLNGNFWLFGGTDYNFNTFGDLWKYDPVSNEWTWIKGSGIPFDPGNYGTQGVPSLFNNPSSRGWGTCSWVDAQGFLWMFGGASPGMESDLWKYDISTNEWTWMKGPNVGGQAGIYGTQGVPNIANNPGARYECATAWTDNGSDLWLFGGYSSPAYFNDLWRFNIASNLWTWMKGSQLTNQIGTYGSIGIENSQNTPGARQSYSHWKDNNGKLWLFGGSNGGYFNDMWRYNITTNSWTWMNGDSAGSSLGFYGTKCIVTTSNYLGGRKENRAVWKDQYGNLWFFGGAQGPNFQLTWNDLWKYCVSTDQWIWQSGDGIYNSIGYWGTSGVSSPNNKPPGKAGAVGWKDQNNHLYLFGGSTVGFNAPYNDIWRFTIDTSCGVCPTITDIQENNITSELLVFPNPTNSSLTISFSSSEKQTVELRIYNTLGEQIYFTREDIIKGKFEKEINVEKWSEGIYFLQVKTKEGNMNRKVIINH